MTNFEKPPSPPEYGEEALEADMREWVERQIKQSADQRREWKQETRIVDTQNDAYLRSLNGLQLFRAYQNNFWARLPGHFYYLTSTEGMPEKRVKFQEDLHKAIDALGFDVEELKTYKNPLKEEQLEKIRALYLEMVKMGYSRLDLIG